MRGLWIFLPGPRARLCHPPNALPLQVAAAVVAAAAASFVADSCCRQCRAGGARAGSWELAGGTQPPGQSAKVLCRDCVGVEKQVLGRAGGGCDGLTGWAEPRGPVTQICGSGLGHTSILTSIGTSASTSTILV